MEIKSLCWKGCIWYINLKGSSYTFKGDNSIKTLLPQYWKGSSLKGNNLLPLGANHFLLKKTPLQSVIYVQERKQEVTTIVSILKMAENLPSVPAPPFHLFQESKRSIPPLLSSNYSHRLKSVLEPFSRYHAHVKHVQKEFYYKQGTGLPPVQA